MRRYIVVGTSSCCKSNLIAGKIGSSLCVYCDECENVWDSVENAEDVNKAFYSTNGIDYPTKEEIEIETNWPILDIIYDSNRFLAEERMNQIYKSERYYCPVCESNSLREQPYDPCGTGSFEMCNVCGYIFGKLDGDNKIESQKKWRDIWETLGSIDMNNLSLFEKMDYYNKLYGSFKKS